MNFYRHITVIIISVILCMISSPALAGGAETIEDALSVVDIALETEDYDALDSIINPDYGLNVGGYVIYPNELEGIVNDETERDFEFVTADGIELAETSFAYFLWGDNGAFTEMNNVTMAHFMEIDRDELPDDSTMEMWEHGEFEVAVVEDDENTVHVYIFPDLLYRVTFQSIDELWHITAIAARAE